MEEFPEGLRDKLDHELDRLFIDWLSSSIAKTAWARFAELYEDFLEQLELEQWDVSLYSREADSFEDFAVDSSKGWLVPCGDTRRIARDHFRSAVLNEHAFAVEHILNTLDVALAGLAKQIGASWNGRSI